MTLGIKRLLMNPSDDGHCAWPRSLSERDSGVEASARIWLFHRLKPRLQGSKTLHLVYSDRLLVAEVFA
mgnify:CR=1 FL=1